MTSPELIPVAELQQQNAEDIAKLARGMYGKPVQFQPLKFELAAIQITLDRLFESLNPDKAEECQREIALILQETISGAISASRQALITEGAVAPQDADAAAKAARKLEVVK